MPQTIAVTICATKDYQYAMTAQARAVHANLRGIDASVKIILVGDEGMKKIGDLYRALFEKAPNTEVISVTGFKEIQAVNYDKQAQLLIAQMRTVAFSKARSLNADLCWSLDSDVIPKSSNCFRTLKWLLEMPDGYYGVAISPYPSQGGGDMLTGRGSPQNPIMPDFREEERLIPEELASKLKAARETISAIAPPATPSRELIEELAALNKKIQECPPKGNVFKMNAESGFRRRGWLSAAYPGLGRGAIVPSDWCGFGSTLMSRRALDECDFIGYDGGGTEDLFIVWHRWHQNGIRIGSAIHEPSFHVSRRKDKRKFISFVRFVTDDDDDKGECVGHHRTMQRPFYAHEAGEQYDPENDGNPIAPEDRNVTPQKDEPKADVPLADPATKAPSPA